MNDIGGARLCQLPSGAFTPVAPEGAPKTLPSCRPGRSASVTDRASKRPPPAQPCRPVAGPATVLRGSIMCCSVCSCLEIGTAGQHRLARRKRGRYPELSDDEIAALEAAVRAERDVVGGNTGETA